MKILVATAFTCARNIQRNKCLTVRDQFYHYFVLVAVHGFSFCIIIDENSIKDDINISVGGIGRHCYLNGKLSIY